MLDMYIVDIVERAIGGEHISASKLLPLFDVGTDAPEVALVRWAARKIAEDASHHTGQIYAQIGIDALPCPVDCDFCTFAVSRSDASARDAIVPLEQVVAHARAFDKAGVHLISLMATAGLPFERILETIAAVREAVSDDMPLLCNIGDLSLEQALAVHDAGAQAAYHAHRLGEGILTSAEPETRRTTMHNIKKAGLKLMNAVEPVHSGIEAEVLLSRMAETLSFRPYCSGVGTLTTVAGTPMEYFAPISHRRAAYYANIMRLMAGDSVPFGVGGGNVVWADSGTNPRGRDLPTVPEVLERNVARLRKELVRDEWAVPDRPLPFWFE